MEGSTQFVTTAYVYIGISRKFNTSVNTKMAAQRRWNSLLYAFLFCANVSHCVRTSGPGCAYPVAQPCQSCDPNCAINCTSGGGGDLEKILEDFAHSGICTVGGNETCCSVYVPPGEYYLTKALYFGNKSLKVIRLGDVGDDSPTTLRCNFTLSSSPPACNPSYPASHTYGALPCMWGFTGSDQVRFEGVAMEDCPGPVSIEGATTVDIVNSNFRYSLHITGLYCTVEPLYRGHLWDPTGCPV